VETYTSIIVQLCIYENNRKAPEKWVNFVTNSLRLAGKDDSVRFYFISADDMKRIALPGGANLTVDRPFILH
jgi:hypothetical protein